MVTLARLPDFFAGVIKLQDDAGLAVNIIDVVVGVKTDAVRIEQNTLAPGTEKISLTVQNQNRMFGSRTNMHPVSRVHCHSADLPPFVADGELAPPFCHIILVRPISYRYGHSFRLLSTACFIPFLILLIISLSWLLVLADSHVEAKRAR